MKIDQDFVKRHGTGQHDALGIQALGTVNRPALIHHQLHHVANLFAHADQEHFDDRLFDRINFGRVRHKNWVIDILQGAIIHAHAVDHTRIGGDNVAFVFTAQALLHNFHVQQTQKPAAEAEAQRHARLGLILERTVVERQFLHRVLQFFVVVGIDRIEPREYHGMHGLEPRHEVRRRCASTGNGITHQNFRGVLDVGHQIAHLPRLQGLHRQRLGIKNTDFLDFVVLARAHQPNTVAAANRPIKHPHINHPATEGIVFGIKHQPAHLARMLRYRRGDPLHQRLEHLRYARTGLGTDAHAFLTRDRKNIFDLLLHGLHIRRHHVGFVQNRDDFDMVAGG